MKELDFDELDRAVNSLMGGASKSQPTEKTLEITASSPLPHKESVPSETVQVSKGSVSVSAVTVTSKSPVVSPRRSGRFMDMVSASPSTKPRSTSAPTVSSREGLTITPRPEAVGESVTSSSEAPAAPQETVSTDMPDVIEVKQITTQSEPSVTTPAVTSAADSPFLADTKVDKRPLNSGNVTELNIDEAKAVSPHSNADSSDPVSKIPEQPPRTPKVPELDSELIAIESAESLDASQPVATVTSADVAAGSVTSPVQPLGSTSISQQYTAQPSSGDKSHAAIYDSSQFPEPISHPAKKKSGWLWVLWVLLLLGIGAGGAVALYGFGIIP